MDGDGPAPCAEPAAKILGDLRLCRGDCGICFGCITAATLGHVGTSAAPLAAQFNNSGLDQINRADTIRQIICDPCGHGNLATCVSDQQNRTAFDTVFVLINQGGQILARNTGVSGKDLPALIDEHKNRVESGAILLIADTGGKVAVAAGVTNDLTDRVSAVDLVKAAVVELGGKGGGGRPDMAQGGGSDASKADAAIAAAEAQIT